MTAPGGLLLTRDLMFTSKITGTAASLGMVVETVGDVEQLAQRAAEALPSVVFFDLNDATLDPAAAMAALSADPRPLVIAFGSHVDEARLAKAREAGCDEVMPRSRFSATLPELLQRLMAGR